jgi:hypothetical protein
MVRTRVSNAVTKQPINTDKSTTIASASTVDLSTMTGNFGHITGNTGPITSFGTVAAGALRWLTFDSNPQINHSANIILPGGLNIVAAAGDAMLVGSEGSGVWRCLMYQKANGRAVKPEYWQSSQQTIPAAAGLLTVAHTLSGRPDFVWIVAVCTVAANGFSVGDEFPLPDYWTNGASVNNSQIYVDDNNNINVRAGGTNSIAVIVKNTGAAAVATPSNYAYVVRAIKF